MSYIIFNKQHSKVLFDVKTVTMNAKYLILDIARNSRWRKDLANTLEIDQIFRSLLGINIGYWPRPIWSRQHRADQYSFLKIDLTGWYSYVNHFNCLHLDKTISNMSHFIDLVLKNK